jgi:hypothetical protein
MDKPDAFISTKPPFAKGEIIEKMPFFGVAKLIAIQPLIFHYHNTYIFIANVELHHPFN